MKAVIEIELEMDGQYKAKYRDTIIDLIMANPGYGCWEVNDKLLVCVKSLECKLAKSYKVKMLAETK